MNFKKAFYVALASIGLGVGICYYDYSIDRVYIFSERDVIDVLANYDVEHKYVPQDGVRNGLCVTGLTLTGSKKIEIHDRICKEDERKTIPHELLHGYLDINGLKKLNSEPYHDDIERKAEKIYYQLFEGGK